MKLRMVTHSCYFDTGGLLEHGYERFVTTTDESSKDMLAELKSKALKAIYFMLTSKSEQERKLLVSLVNKVNFLSQIRLSHEGDDPKVAKRLIDVYFSLYKVLTTEANRKSAADDKVADKKNANPKDKKEEKSSDSPVELDSRIL